MTDIARSQAIAIRARILAAVKHEHAAHMKTLRAIPFKVEQDREEFLIAANNCFAAWIELIEDEQTNDGEEVAA